MLDKQQFTYTIIYSPQEAGDYDLGFALTHYNIYPWIREENTLVRVLRTESSDSIVLAVVERHQPGTGITGKVLSQTKLRDGDLQWIHRRLAHCLGLGLIMRQWSRRLELIVFCALLLKSTKVFDRSGTVLFSRRHVALSVPKTSALVGYIR